MGLPTSDTNTLTILPHDTVLCMELQSRRVQSSLHMHYYSQRKIYNTRHTNLR